MSPVGERRLTRRAAMRAVRNQRGFTLLELLVSLTIVAILALAQAAPFQRAIASREEAEAAMERSNAARLTLQRLAEELTGAVPLPGPDRAFQVTEQVLDRPASRLRFATTAARRVRTGVQDPIEIVEYRLEGAPEGRQGAVLVKEQLPSVAAPGTPPASFIVLEDVAAFTVRVLPDRGEPLTTWQGRSGGVKIPRAVELQLALDDGSEDPPVYRLLIDLPMGGRQER